MCYDGLAAHIVRKSKDVPKRMDSNLLVHVARSFKDVLLSAAHNKFEDSQTVIEHVCKIRIIENKTKSL